MGSIISTSSKDSTGWEFVKCSKCNKNKASYRISSDNKLEENEFYSTTVNGRYRYTACDDCASPKVHKNFAYILGGWKEHIKYHQEYETNN